MTTKQPAGGKHVAGGEGGGSDENESKLRAIIDQLKLTFKDSSTQEVSLSISTTQYHKTHHSTTQQDNTIKHNTTK